MVEILRAAPIEGKYKRGERRAKQEQTLGLLLQVNPLTMDEILTKVHTQLVRLLVVTPGRTDKSPREKIEMVLRAFGNTDSAVAKEYEATRNSLRRYRRDVVVALAFVLSQGSYSIDGLIHLSPEEEHRFDRLVEIQRRSELIERKLNNEQVSETLADFPHVRELLRAYQEYGDVNPLLREAGIDMKKREKRYANDAVKAYLFGQTRRGSKRENEGVEGVRLWARRLVLGRWYKNGTDYRGREIGSKKISLAAAAIISRPLENPDRKLWMAYHGASRFFEKILEKEFLSLRDDPGPIFKEFFPLKDSTGELKSFEDVDVASSYRVYADYHLVPGSLRDLIKSVVDGGSRTNLGRSLPNGEFYSESEINRWMRSGLMLVERCLLLWEVPSNRVKFFPKGQGENLREAKREILQVN